MKLTKYIFISTIALVFSITKLSAQNILSSTIEWNSNSTFNASTGDLTVEVTKIVTSSTQIIWYDDQGTTRQSFDIFSSEGSWNNVSSNGSILFRMKSGESFGIAQFSKTGSTWTIRIQLVLEEESLIYEFTITNINAL